MMVLRQCAAASGGRTFKAARVGRRPAADCRPPDWVLAGAGACAGALVVTLLPDAAAAEPLVASPPSICMAARDIRMAGSELAAGNRHAHRQ